MVLKEPGRIFNSFYFGRVLVLKELIFIKFLLRGVCGGLERTDFSQLIL